MLTGRLQVVNLEPLGEQQHIKTAATTIVHFVNKYIVFFKKEVLHTRTRVKLKYKLDYEVNGGYLAYRRAPDV